MATQQKEEKEGKVCVPSNFVYIHNEKPTGNQNLTFMFSVHTKSKLSGEQVNVRM